MKFTRKFVIGGIVGILAGAALGAGAIQQFTTPVAVADGAASLPAYTFISDKDTGFYHVASGDIGVASNGVLVGKLNDTGFYAPGGSAALPGLSFTNDGDTGFYRVGSGDIGVSSNGSLVGKLNDTGFYAPAGTQSLPGLSFANDPDTGVYRSGSGTVAVSSNGTQVAEFGTTSGALTLSQYLQFDSGGAFKVKLFTGSLSSSSSTTLTAPSGVILSAIGYTQLDGSSTWFMMPLQPSTTCTISASSCISFDASTSTSTSTPIVNQDTNSTNSYRVVMYYQ